VRRLVYSPKVYAFVRTDKYPDGLDISDYIVRGNVHRRVNAASTCELELRNPKRMFTHPGTPTFLPMDPITVYLTRLKGYPVQVFTGYLDQVDTFTLFPDTITLTASCTLKRLLHTFWDPALPYLTEEGGFLSRYGWKVDRKNGVLMNPDAISKALGDSENKNLTDGSMGALLFALLKHVGSWDPEDIFIERLPEGIVDRMTEMYSELASENKDVKDNIDALLNKLLGPGAYGEAGTDTSQGGDIKSTYKGPLNRKFPKHLSGTPGITLTPAQVKEIAESVGLPGELFTQIARGESAYQPGVQQRDPGDGMVGYGLWQMTPNAWGTNSEAYEYFMKLGGIPEMFNPVKNAMMAKFLYDKAPSKVPNTRGFPWYGTKYVTSNAVAEAANAVPNSGAAPEATTKKPKKKAKKNERVKPVKGGTYSWNYGQNRGTHSHAGVDIAVPVGTEVYAAHAGTVRRAVDPQGYGNYIDVVGDGVVTRYGHLSAYKASDGQSVSAGDVIALSGNTGRSSGPHVHFEVRSAQGFGFAGTMNPQTWLNGTEDPDGSGSPGTTTEDDVDVDGGGGDTSRATAFAAYLNFPGVEATAEAIGLQGQKSLMNDQPLFPFIKQVAEASLRNFQSLPNGDFYAFFPDYFGGFGHRTPYWLIDDIEILDGKISLSDDQLATHVYVVGDIVPDNQINFMDRLQSGGVISMFDAFKANFVRVPADLGGTGKTSEQTIDPRTGNAHGGVRQATMSELSHDYVVRFLQKYGVRPHYEEQPMVRSPYFEAFLAYQRFQQLWAAQFSTPFTFTFMPEIFPGGIVGFPDHNLQCYVEEVVHSFDYENGFATQAVLSAPASMSDSGTNISAGMIRAFNYAE